MAKAKAKVRVAARREAGRAEAMQTNSAAKAECPEAPPHARADYSRCTHVAFPAYEAGELERQALSQAAPGTFLATCPLTLVTGAGLCAVTPLALKTCDGAYFHHIFMGTLSTKAVASGSRTSYTGASAVSQDIADEIKKLASRASRGC